MPVSEIDEHFLRRSFEVARRASTHGNHPFGAILVDADRNVLIEAENGYMPDHDGTAHAERLLATQACTTLNPDVRTLLQVKVPHADLAEQTFSTLMGDVVEPRRDFIQLNALDVANLDV